MFSSYLYKSKASSIVSNSEAKGVFRLVHFYLLFDPSNVGEDKILQADLPPQKLLHVNLVGVEGTEQDLQRDTLQIQ